MVHVYSSMVSIELKSPINIAANWGIFRYLMYTIDHKILAIKLTCLSIFYIFTLDPTFDFQQKWNRNARFTIESTAKGARQQRDWLSLLPFMAKPRLQPVRSSGERRRSTLRLRLVRLLSVCLCWMTTGHFISQRQWRSGGWRKWTPAGPRLEPHLKKTTFISPPQSQTAAGLWTYRRTPRRFITTRHWLTPVGRCPET